MKEEIKFEDAISKLEEIANDLENGDLSLDESVRKFEEGMEMSKKCSKLLNNAEKKITVLVDENNEINEKEFIIDKGE